MVKKTSKRKTGYDSDLGDEEWAFCAPYLTLMKEDAPQREWFAKKKGSCKDNGQHAAILESK